MVQALPTTAHVFASKLHYYGLGVRHSHRVPSTHEVCQTLRTERLHRIPDLARLIDFRYSGARVHAQLVVHAAFAPSDLSITIPSVNLLHHSESAIYTPQSRTHA
ncbi:hypothetical protein HBH56_119420 [Parastagonospora nodorum]|uniref:Uncharacterized protein n=1 Tax=Phaeosphaeria nodorum (strain SN15 / ATCC MYA-4574 / FGSC 10173) TaxID=321614 RepID=A0A7U2NP27_PHANO|nr:hypothetical protein HBH56_119420 [Parastagonospora nodorum]QRD05372.1 hypothetical protein JI435_444330 [Parastagonospora nodorum SN15]KAH3928916.1 hypothetical protein HBH54_129770 [Parastagonospora nodorum]KAH3959804.1 hypothetical protein HBH51_197800 [Parastagonospora nodorum]KAH4104217.1 hypothetical protein HBH46_102920 [Parastagonospora nodorum]